MSSNLSAWLHTALRHTPARALYNIYRHAGLPQGDVYLDSYPKSGNTWLKMMLVSIILDPDASFDETEALIPAIGQQHSSIDHLE